MALEKNQATIEYGDFQTPKSLAAQICQLVSRLGYGPQTVLEPTCGVGHFLSAALQSFPSLTHVAGVEINPEYAAAARLALAAHCAQQPDVVVDICVADFFVKEWESYLAKLPDPILIIGNPPWVTSAEIGNLNGDNLPPKRDEKRPITIRLLRKLDISALADELGFSDKYAVFASKGYQNASHVQLQLLEKRTSYDP